jgi:hypothetical protein
VKRVKEPFLFKQAKMVRRFMSVRDAFRILFTEVAMWLNQIQWLKQNLENRLLAKLILQGGKAPRVRGRSAEENPVLT